MKKPNPWSKEINDILMFFFTDVKSKLFKKFKILLCFIKAPKFKTFVCKFNLLLFKKIDYHKPMHDLINVIASETKPITITTLISLKTQL